jgi:hypothetical protein
MALTPNPLRNATSGQGDISGQKLLQDFFAVNPTIGTSGLAVPVNQSYAWNLFPNTPTNAAVIANLNGNANINPVGVTWYLVSGGNHSIWVSNAQGIPAAGPVPGTTIFQRVYFDGNDLFSAGDFSAGGSLQF